MRVGPRRWGLEPEERTLRAAFNFPCRGRRQIRERLSTCTSRIWISQSPACPKHESGRTRTERHPSRNFSPQSLAIADRAETPKRGDRAGRNSDASRSRSPTPDVLALPHRDAATHHVSRCTGFVRVNPIIVAGSDIPPSTSLIGRASGRFFMNIGEVGACVNKMANFRFSPARVGASFTRADGVPHLTQSPSGIRTGKSRCR